jgi:adenylyl cyclase-associated protein
MVEYLFRNLPIIMAQASLDKLAAALAKIESRLAVIEGKLGGSAPGGGAGAGSGPSLEAFDTLVSAHLPSFVAKSKEIATDVGQHAELFEKAVAELRGVIAKASTMKKPSDMSTVIGGLAAAMGAVTDFEGKNRKTQHRDHLSAIANGVSALGWVAVEKTPGPFAKEQGETAFLYTNRVLSANKGKEGPHTEWAKTFADFLKELPTYIKSYHTTGLTFQ